MTFYVVELLDDWNVDVPSWKYPRNLESPRMSSPGFDNDSKRIVINRRSTALDLSRQLSSATGRTVSRQTVYRRLGHIGLYARRFVRCVPLSATHCRLRLTWSREHALWTPQQWSCVMFSDESRFSLQSDSRRTLIWRVPGTCYHQENTIERHRYSGAGWLIWGGIILGSRTYLPVQSVIMRGHIYWDVILEQHVRLFRGAMGAEFLFMDDNARPHTANILDKCLQSKDITRIYWPAYSPDLNPIEHVGDMLGRRIAARQPLPTCLQELRRALLDEWCNIPQDQIDNLILSIPMYCKAFIASSGRHTVAAVAEWYRYRIVACLVTSSIPVPLKTRRIGQRCTLNLSRAETSSRWCGVVVRRGGCQLTGVVHVT
ncbi:transposable element Tcb1 transposase [Trichonephila clavipes]|nr:transposable element Tcb1 transposase [Trichonephila clavipes]